MQEDGETVEKEVESVEDQFLIPLYQKFPIKIVRGSGALLYDSSGRPTSIFQVVTVLQ